MGESLFLVKIHPSQSKLCRGQIRKLVLLQKMLTTVLGESTSNNANVISQLSHGGLNSPWVKVMGTRGGSNTAEILFSALPWTTSHRYWTLDI